MTKVMHFSNGRVVCVLMGDKEGRLDIATIWVSSLLGEDLLIQVNISNIDGIVKGQHDHLWDPITSLSLRTQSSRHLGPILGTKAVGEPTQISIAWKSTIWIGVSI